MVWLKRIWDEMAQAVAIAAKDVRTYYMTPPMLMFGLFMPFFMFFSFSVRRGLGTEASVARLLALTCFFTASSVEGVIIPLERRDKTFERLLAAPISLISILLGKMLVGVFFTLGISLATLLVGWAFLKVTIVDPGLLVVCLILSTWAFSALGLLFASFPTASPGNIMMPSTLLRWPLLFISGIFIPLDQMAPWARAISYLSPLTYSQDLMNHAVLGQGLQPLLLDLGAMLFCLGLLLFPTIKLHDRARRLGL